MNYLIIVFLLIEQILNFSIPGVSLQSFKLNQKISMQVNELDSLTTLFPLSYYDMNFCKPDDIDFKYENLGTSLLGEETQNTPYEIFSEKNENCKLLCQSQMNINESKIQFAIDHDYKINFVIDNLPAVVDHSNHLIGYRIGFKENDTYYINNHITICIHIYKIDSERARVVKFDVKPKSILHSNTETRDCSKELQKQPLTDQVIFSYDVFFVFSDKQIGSRWDLYEDMDINSNHWVSIINSVLILFALAFITYYIMRSILKRDLQRYENEIYEMVNLESQELREPDENSWKQLSRDVFVPPKIPMIMAMFIGTGINCLLNITCLITIMCLGFMNITYRGQTLTLAIIFQCFFSVFCGYCCAKFYKLIKGQDIFMCLLFCGSFYPLVNFITVFFVNIFLELEQSSSSIDFKTILELIILYIFVQMPLVFLGGLVGHRQKIFFYLFNFQVIQIPCKPNLISKKVPPQPYYNNYFFTCFVGGLIPFGSVFYELRFLMTGLWKHSFYYLFTYLEISFICLIVTSSLISIILTYVQLSKGNHRWWWKAFLAPASSSIFLMIYSFVYFFKYLQLTRFSSIVMYFSYMFLMSFNLFLITGTIGLISSAAFVLHIYSLIKHD